MFRVYCRKCTLKSNVVEIWFSYVRRSVTHPRVLPEVVECVHHGLAAALRTVTGGPTNNTLLAATEQGSCIAITTATATDSAMHFKVSFAWCNLGNPPLPTDPAQEDAKNRSSALVSIIDPMSEQYCQSRKMKN